MIESIEIKNFRCFKDTKIAKFGLVNLFGGLNNSGKTALLEAIILVKNPCYQIVPTLQSFRGESDLFIKAKPENAWDSFFYQHNIKDSIEINIIDNKLDCENILLRCDDNINEFIDFAPKNLNKDVSNYINSIELSKKSALHITGKDIKEATYLSILVASNTGIVGVNNFERIIESATYFRLPTKKKKNSELAVAYEQARFDGKGELVLKALQIVDKTIEKIDVFFIGEPIIYLTKTDNSRSSINLFGDAMSTVAEIILAMISNPNTTVLIDEIENGIHYTNQKKLWEMLFKLAIEYNVQIFSTSHSLEMIKAFAKVAQQFPEKAAYFEMARHYKTGNIIGTSIPIDVLEYDIKQNSSFRGEPI
jgi:AAA15 family ATPase/GTPase